jgi:hypothetical protein
VSYPVLIGAIRGKDGGILGHKKCKKAEEFFTTDFTDYDGSESTNP